MATLTLEILVLDMMLVSSGSVALCFISEKLNFEFPDLYSSHNNAEKSSIVVSLYQQKPPPLAIPTAKTRTKVKTRYLDVNNILKSLLSI